MKRKPFKTSENIMKVVSWNFVNGAIKTTKIKYVLINMDVK